MTDVPHPSYEAHEAWRPTSAYVRATAVALAGPLVALAWHRADVLVATAPLVVIAAWSALARPSGPLQVTGTVSRVQVREGESVVVRFEVTAPAHAQEVSVSCGASPWAELDPPHGAVLELVDTASQQADARIVARMTRWGMHGLGPAAVVGLSPWASFVSRRWRTDDHTVEALPVAPLFDSGAPMPHPQGLVGVDRSVRGGEGSEFSTIRPFQAGDRLRRVHWPSTLRTGHVNVTATYADHDSHVVVLVDAANDVGRSGGVDGAASTLDSTVRSAAALCEHYVRRGDRVGLVISSALHPLHLRSAPGRRHLRRMLSALASAVPGGFLPPDADVQLRIDPGAMVFVCSPLISPLGMERAVTLGRRGLTIVVVDTLPESVTHHLEGAPGVDRVLDLAWRIRMLQRDVEVRKVLALGVPVVPWRGPGSLDHVLQQVARRGRAPRMAQR